MAPSTPSGPVRRILARFGSHGAGTARSSTNKSSTNGPAPGPDLRLPEQRLLDVATRYGRLAVGDRPPTAGQPAAAAGVKIVAATEPSDAGTPAWLRRLGDRDDSSDSAPTTPDQAAAAPASPATRRSPRSR